MSLSNVVQLGLLHLEVIVHILQGKVAKKFLVKHPAPKLFC